MKRKTLTLLAAVVLAGCVSRPNPIPLVPAAPADLAALQGSWSGTYAGTETGRTGTISFDLTAGTDTAHGEVVMLPEGINTPITRSVDGVQSAGGRIGHMSEMLTIAFARVRDGQVSGRLDPYRDPACSCIVNTTFTGTLRDASTLEGTFLTTAQGLFTPRHGEWRVRRLKP